MEVLVISNSFGADANRYVHQIARAAGEKINVATLYIPSCSLERHYRNMLSGEQAYDLHYNGFNTGFKLSLEDALLSKCWDVITMQQASGYSPIPDSYTPYAEEMLDYIRTCQPKAKVLLHQTWGYRDGSEKLEKAGYSSFAQMFADVEKAYRECHRRIGTDGIIPCGQLMNMLNERGIGPLHRDALHASFGLGRYALGLLWFRMLTGRAVADNAFCDFDEAVPGEDIAAIKALVDTFTPVMEGESI